MSDKPWPKSGTVSFTDLVEPIITAIESAYDLQLKTKVFEDGVEWTGLDIGERDKVCCLSPSERLTGDQLRYSYVDQGRNPLAEIVGVAVQLGIEQGRRVQVERAASAAEAKAIKRILQAAGIDPEAKP